MPINYALPKPVAGTPRSGEEVSLMVDVSDTVADIDARITANSTTRRFFSANDFALATGTPSLSSITTARWPAWFLDAASREGITHSFEIPTGWTGMTVRLRWSQASAGSGDVVWIPVHEERTDGDTLDAADVVGSSVVATTPATNVVETTTLLTALAVTAGKMFALRIDRDAAAVGDTLANDCVVLGVIIESA